MAALLGESVGRTVGYRVRLESRVRCRRRRVVVVVVVVVVARACWQCCH
jgi:hypothetical protein